MTPRFKVKSWWWYRPGRWSGLLPSRGGDELGRHTLAVPTVLFGTFVFVLKNCDCDDMAEFRCTEPECPYCAMTTDAPCAVHDPEWMDA